MAEQTLQQKISELISHNETESAFELLSSVQFSHVDKELIILNSQYNRIQEELRLNIISKEEGERRINQINLALLEISNEVTSPKTSVADGNNIPHKKSSKLKWLWLLLIPIAVFSLYFFFSGDGGNNISSNEPGIADVATPPGAGETTTPPIKEPPKPEVKKGALIPTTPVYLKISDANLYLHAAGGSNFQAVETLHPCPKDANYPNCQWVFEQSPTRSYAYYIKSKGANLYLHAFDGAIYQTKMTLHPCPKDADYPNCQWILEPSTTRPGEYYIKSAGASLYLHAAGGSKMGAEITLHHCPKKGDYPNCQWKIVTP